MGQRRPVIVEDQAAVEVYKHEKQAKTQPSRGCRQARLWNFALGNCTDPEAHPYPH